MSIKIKKNDYVVRFWYAESYFGDNFFMLLRKTPRHWRLDWRFFYMKGGRALNWSGKDAWRYYHAFSGLQIREKQAVGEAQEVFQLTTFEYAQRRISQRIDGSGAKLFQVLQKCTIRK